MDKIKKYYPFIVSFVSVILIVPFIVYLFKKYSNIYFIAMGLGVLVLVLYILHQLISPLLGIKKQVKNILDIVIIVPSFLTVLFFIINSGDRGEYYNFLLYFNLVTLGLFIVVSVLDLFNLEKATYLTLAIAPLVIVITYLTCYINIYELSNFIGNLYLILPIVLWISVSLCTLLFFKEKSSNGVTLLGIVSLSLTIITTIRVLFFEFAIQ